MTNRDIDPSEIKSPVQPRKRIWPAFAIVGFLAGVLSVILVVWLWRVLR